MDTTIPIPAACKHGVAINAPTAAPIPAAILAFINAVEPVISPVLKKYGADIGESETYSYLSSK